MVDEFSLSKVGAVLVEELRHQFYAELGGLLGAVSGTLERSGFAHDLLAIEGIVGSTHEPAFLDLFAVGERPVLGVVPAQGVGIDSDLVGEDEAGVAEDVTVERDILGVYAAASLTDDASTTTKVTP